ncbi:MAG: PEGA domain-containing protein [Nannocystaceae bacterium]|nr:PEGA domain-containing protein [Nannocystaceae bacterium]
MAKAAATPVPAAAPGEGIATVAVLPVQVEGELSPADRESLTDELVSGLQRGAFGVVGPAEVLSASPKVEGCAKPKCLASAASDTGATHVLRARVTVADRDYTVSVELYDGRTGESLAKTDESCEICGITDAGNLMESAAATLRTKLDALAKGPSTLSIISEPKGAEVRLDGEIIGVTPMDRLVIPGKAVVRVSKEGFIGIEREVELVEGVAESLSFELEKVPSRLPSRPWGWVSLGVGIAAIGAATGFAVLGITEREYRIGGRCRKPLVGNKFDGPLEDPDGNCRFVWNTEAHALGFGIAGGALTTLGIAILLSSRRGKRGKSADADDGLDAKTARRQSRRPHIGIGLGNLTVQGRF